MKLTRIVSMCFLTLAPQMGRSSLALESVLPASCKEKIPYGDFKWIKLPADFSKSSRLRGYKKIFSNSQLKRIDWVDLEIHEDGKLLTSFALQQNRISVTAYSVTPKNCRRISSRAQLREGQSIDRKVLFSEKDFLREANATGRGTKHKGTVIYLWSNEMSYSVQNLKQFKIWTETAGYKFLPLLAPDANLPKAQSYWANLGLNPADLKQTNSLTLQLLVGPTHFPTSFFLSRGKLGMQPLIGVTTEDEFKDFLFKNYVETHREI